MKKLQFKCTLLSDVIISQKAATEGSSKTLDFIPGNNFLGIVASELYDDKDKNREDVVMALFHQGKVRYGDAHPAKGNARTLRVPASMFYPKLKKPNEECYIFHKIDFSDPLVSDSMRKLQLKQCRTGFYDFTSKNSIKVDMDKNFAIKSAHDRENRTSLVGSMYGYESLCKGLELYFDVESDDESLLPMVENALVGKKRIGRSHSSQYGLIEIKIADNGYKEPASCKSTDDVTVVYADSRLVYIDANTCLPTLRPSADDLGIEGGTILWGKSQVRTFQYSPWNTKRQCFDADRVGFEKGSVFIVKGGKCPETSRYTGNFKCEGFGKVIYNPDFLSADKDGKAIYNLIQDEASDKEPEYVKLEKSDSSLVNCLIARKKKKESESEIYDLVNEWKTRFSLVLKPSQWGTIRSMVTLSGQNIRERLFEKEKGYIVHGKISEKWKTSHNDILLGDFIDSVERKYPNDTNMLRLALINLAAEMAKRTGKEDL